MPSAFVKVYVKRILRLDRLDFSQQSMFALGNIGVGQVIDRASRSLNTEDAPAKPLQKGYAIRKTRLGLGNRRNLKFTGRMLGNLSVRQVSNNGAKASLTSAKERIKGLANERRESWAQWSPKNQERILGSANQILQERILPNLILQRTIT